MHTQKIITTNIVHVEYFVCVCKIKLNNINTIKITNSQNVIAHIVHVFFYIFLCCVCCTNGTFIGLKPSQLPLNINNNEQQIINQSINQINYENRYTSNAI